MQGDDVWLVIPNQQSGVATFVDDVHFRAAKVGEAWGRVPGGRGRLAPLTPATMGEPNAAPRVGPLVISELNYAPANPSIAALAVEPNMTADDLEFVELYNPTGTDLDLTDWRLRGGIDLDFVAGQTVPAGQARLIVSFDPQAAENANRAAAFRRHYGLEPQTILIGGYFGRLDNEAERVALLRPGVADPAEPQVIPHWLEDELLYDDRAPWPEPPAGSGWSLQRRGVEAFGNDGASWLADVPTPGLARFTGGIRGDFDGNGSVDVDDVDALAAQLRSPSPDRQYDLNRDNQVTIEDRDLLILEILNTTYGDANLDGMFNSMDFVLTFQMGEYEDAIQGNSTWADGDWDSDGDFTSADIVLAFQNGGYESHAQMRQNPSEVTTMNLTAAAVAAIPAPTAPESSFADAGRCVFQTSLRAAHRKRHVELVSADHTREILFRLRRRAGSLKNP